MIILPSDLKNPDNLELVYAILGQILGDNNLEAPMEKALKQIRALGETRLAGRIARGELTID